LFLLSLPYTDTAYCAIPRPVQSGKPCDLEPLFPCLHIMSIAEEELMFLKRSKPVLVCLYINIGVTVCAKTGIFSINCKPLSFGIRHEFYVAISHNIYTSFIWVKPFLIK
jgi:hypothetical protein